MFNYKKLDLISQLVTALLAVAGIPLDNSGAVTSISLVALAVLQIISLIANRIIDNKPWKEVRLRKIHLIGLGLVLLIMIYGLFKPGEDKYDFSGLSVIIKALIPAAVMAVFYISITYIEYKNLKNQRTQ